MNTDMIELGIFIAIAVGLFTLLSARFETLTLVICSVFFVAIVVLLMLLSSYKKKREVIEKVEYEDGEE